MPITIHFIYIKTGCLHQGNIKNNLNIIIIYNIFIRIFSGMCIVGCFMKLHSYIVENKELKNKNRNYSVVYSEFMYFVCAPASIF